MKKLIFCTILVFLISCSTFLNANEIKTYADLELEETEVINKTVVVGPWVCYELYRYSTVNMMTGVETITIVYRCFTMNL